MIMEVISLTAMTSPISDYHLSRLLSLSDCPLRPSVPICLQGSEGRRIDNLNLLALLQRTFGEHSPPYSDVHQGLDLLHS